MGVWRLLAFSWMIDSFDRCRQESSKSSLIAVHLLAPGWQYLRVILTVSHTTERIVIQHQHRM